MHSFRRSVLFMLAAAVVFHTSGCTRGVPSVAGWHALQPGVELRLEDCGPNGVPVLSMLYTVVPGRYYAIEGAMPVGVVDGKPEVDLHLSATRVLHLAVVLVDDLGFEHQAMRTLGSGGWRRLRFDGFCPPLQDSAEVRTVRIVDRTGSLGGQGPVSLKLTGIPLGL